MPYSLLDLLRFIHGLSLQGGFGADGSIGIPTPVPTFPPGVSPYPIKGGPSDGLFRRFPKPPEIGIPTPIPQPIFGAPPGVMPRPIDRPPDWIGVPTPVPTPVKPVFGEGLFRRPVERPPGWIGIPNPVPQPIQGQPPVGIPLPVPPPGVFPRLPGSEFSGLFRRGRRPEFFPYG